MRFVQIWCIWDHLVAFETRCKTGQTSAKVRAMKSRRNFLQRTHPIHPCDPQLTFWCIRTIWVHSGLFGCLAKLGAKRAELVQKFVPQSRVGIFCNERTRSTLLDNIQMFWCVRTIWVHLGLFSCLTKLVAKRAEQVQVRATKLRRNFSQQKHPIHRIVP